MRFSTTQRCRQLRRSRATIHGTRIAPHKSGWPAAMPALTSAMPFLLSLRQVNTAGNPCALSAMTKRRISLKYSSETQTVAKWSHACLYCFTRKTLKRSANVSTSAKSAKLTLSQSFASPTLSIQSHLRPSLSLASNVAAASLTCVCARVTLSMLTSSTAHSHILCKLCKRSTSAK